MKKRNLIIASALVLLVAFACKVPKDFLSGLKVNPNPLELKGGKVECKVEGTFPAKYFVKNMELTIVPVLKSKTTGAVLKGSPKVYQGESIKGNNPVINYKKGGKYEQSVSFVYSPEFEQSELFMEATAKIKKKTIAFEPVKVADGVITTPNLVYENPAEMGVKIIPDAFQKVIEQKQDAEIKFLIQQSNIRSTELKSQNFVDLTKKIKDATASQGLNLKGLEISSYASPDGGVELNEGLAQAREKETAKYINSQLKKLKANVTISGKFTAQDWEGFKTLIESSSIQDKEVILKVLSMYSDPEQREKEIKNLSVAYKEIAEKVLPQLRRSKLVLSTEVLGKSDEDIKLLAKTNPSGLNVEELLYAATLTNDAKEKENIYQQVVNIYPNDVRGYNNLGAVKFAAGDLQEADKNFTKALQLDKNNAVANYNKGVVLIANGDVENAETYLGNAGGVGDDLNLANGAIAIVKGDYKTAVGKYGNSVTNNAALAKILNKDYSGARKVLDAVENPNAKTYYLQSIVAARTNDTTNLLKNVANTLNADKTYKDKFLGSSEFLPFIANGAFSALLK
jgi:Flp pilus assembly protein TadD